MKILIRWFAAALTLLIIAYTIPGIAVSGVYSALITIVILSLVNAIIRPVFILLTLPINVFTLGFFTFVINGLLFWFVSSFIQGFDIDNFLAAFIGALILTISSWVVNSLLHTDK